MRVLAGLLVAAWLAGCSALAPPPVAEERPEPLPIPKLTPTLPRGCAPTIAIEPHDLALAPGIGAWWDVVLRPSGSCLARLSYGSACARDVIEVTIGEARWAAPFERGAAWEGETACTPEAWTSEEPPTIPSGFELRRRYQWNGSVGEACDGQPIGRCVTFRDAPEGTYAIRARAFTADGEPLLAEANVTVHAFCADLFLVGAEPGPHEMSLAVDNETVGGLAWTAAEGDDPAPLGRWCGERGEHWLTLVDERTGKKEEALVGIAEDRIHLRASPLRAAPFLVH